MSNNNLPPVTLPANTLIGNISSLPGPAATIPLATLSQLTQVPGLQYVQAGGTSDALTANFPNVLSAYNGLTVLVGITSTNATTTPTLAVTVQGSLQTAYPIKKFVANAEVAVAAGDLQGIVMFVFDSVNSVWVALLSQANITNATNVTGSAVVTGAVRSGTNPKFSAYATGSTLSLTSGANTKIPFNTVEFNIGSMYDPTTNFRFQPTIAGYYLISASVDFYGAPVNSGEAYIYKNGSYYVAGSQADSDASGVQTSVITKLMYLNGTTDYVEIFGLAFGTTLQFKDTDGSFFSGTLIP